MARLRWAFCRCPCRLSVIRVEHSACFGRADPLPPLGRGEHDCPALTARPQRAAAHRSALPADVQPITDISSGDWTSLRELAAILQEQLPSPCVIGFNESNVLLSPAHCASGCRALPCSERFDDPPLAALGTARPAGASDVLALHLLQRVGRRCASLHSCPSWSPPVSAAVLVAGGDQACACSSCRWWSEHRAHACPIPCPCLRHRMTHL